jgi:hypothetical protein
VSSNSPNLFACPINKISFQAFTPNRCIYKLHMNYDSNIVNVTKHTEQYRLNKVRFKKVLIFHTNQWTLCALAWKNIQNIKILMLLLYDRI